MTKPEKKSAMNSLSLPNNWIKIRLKPSRFRTSSNNSSMRAWWLLTGHQVIMPTSFLCQTTLLVSSSANRVKPLGSYNKIREPRFKWQKNQLRALISGMFLLKVNMIGILKLKRQLNKLSERIVSLTILLFILEKSHHLAYRAVRLRSLIAMLAWLSEELAII